MSPPQQSRINKVLEELKLLQTIPSTYWNDLGDRLYITCQSFERKQPGKAAESTNKYRARHKLKKANRVYLQILDFNPHIYIPFVLAIPPRTCDGFDISQFYVQNSKDTKLHLNIDARRILDGIAKKRKFDCNPFYLKLINNIFSKEGFQKPKPASSADGDEHWAFEGAHLEKIPLIFGSRVGKAIESSQVLLGEKAQSPLLLSTSSVRAKLPRKNFEDGIIWLHIGFAGDFARTMFPQSRSLAIQSPDSPLENLTGTEATFAPSLNPVIDETDYFTFEGADVSAISLIFDAHIVQAIEASQLRAWEKEHGILDTTECVAMQVCRKERQQGTVRLRVGFILGMPIISGFTDANTIP